MIFMRGSAVHEDYSTVPGTDSFRSQRPLAPVA